MGGKAGSKQRKVAKAARRLAKLGLRPTYHVELAYAEVVELPWLEFGGNHPAEIAEAARRAVAAELGVPPESVVVEADLDG
jgi:hypothetical protein